MFKKWEEDMWKWCKDHNAEPKKLDNGDIAFVCPRRPSKEEIGKLEKIIPDDFESAYKFEESIKNSTIHKIVGTLSALNAGVEIRGGHRSAQIRITGHPQMKEHEQIWEDINNWLTTDGFLDRWEVYLNGDLIVTVNKVLERELERNNSIREQVIGKDEVTNLRINLETMSVDEFLKTM